MAHADQFEFVALVKQLLPRFFKGTKVLEIGSLDINGAVRSLFDTTDYTGVDVAPGPGVDEVCQGQLVSHATGTFDTVISCECMEHNPFWVETVSNMFRMTKPGGLTIVSCATTGRAEHGTSRTSGSDSPLSIGIGWEYYRNISVAEFERTFRLDDWFEDHLLLANWHHCDLYFVGVKKPSGDGQAVRSLREALAARFRPTQSFRSICTLAAARSGGERGVGVLRALWRLVPQGSRT